MNRAARVLRAALLSSVVSLLAVSALSWVAVHRPDRRDLAEREARASPYLGGQAGPTRAAHLTR